MQTRLKKTILFSVLALTALAFSSCYPTSSGPPYRSYRNVPGSSSYNYHSSAFGGPRYYYNDYYDDRYYYRKDGDRIKLTAGQQRGKSTRPEGYHPREWYEKRGYDLDVFKHKHEDSGNTHAGDRYRSPSSSSRSRSNSGGSSRSSSSSSSNKSRSSSGGSSRSSGSRSSSSKGDSDSDSRGGRRR